MKWAEDGQMVTMDQPSVLHNPLEPGLAENIKPILRPVRFMSLVMNTFDISKVANSFICFYSIHLSYNLCKENHTTFVLSLILIEYFFESTYDLVTKSKIGLVVPALNPRYV